MNIIRFTAFKTNYIWLIYNHRKESIIVDPGETITILKFLKNFQFNLQAILLTHHHNDHIGGVNTLVQNFPKIVVYGPIETQNKGATSIVAEGDYITLLQKKFKVLNLPGHTLHHIGFYSAPWFFCGDTVFSSGCGRIYEGSSQQMYESFLKIRCLPKNTLIFGGHEYTLSNVNFAISILPTDKSIINYRKKIIKLREKNQPTIPTELKLELKINPFFRSNHLSIKKSLQLFPIPGEEWQVFSELRKRKDIF